MTPIDLIDYTRSSHKIPAAALKPSHVQSAPPATWKILAGYFLDFSTVTALTFTMSGLFKLSFNNLMVTRSLSKAFGAIPFQSLTTSMLPLMFVSYFFFSYFFNHGQTVGMKMMKTRIEMPEMNFRSSFLWGMFSSAVFMTAGLSFVLTYKWMQKKGWGEVKGHDHLYEVLMTERHLSPVNLVEMANGHLPTAADETVEETYLEAA